MGRHIVGAFAVVDKRGIAVGHQAGREMFEIAAHGRIGIFADDQRCARVIHEYVTQLLDDPGSLDNLFDLASNPRRFHGHASRSSGFGLCMVICSC